MVPKLQRMEADLPRMLTLLVTMYSLDLFHVLFNRKYKYLICDSQIRKIITIVPFFSYTVSAHRLECITSAYPSAVEGSAPSPRLQSSIITNGQLFTSHNSDESFYYDWNYTPQVRKFVLDKPHVI